MNIYAHWRLLAAASMVVAGLAGCGGSDGTTVPPATVPPASIDFLLFTNQAFSNSANSLPVSLDVTFNFDVNDDPNAFDTLIASGSFGAGS